jgi:aspartate-semialdehyde dehydrogenase
MSHRTRTRGLRVAVVGATGLVGQEFFRVLAQRAFPVAELRALASEQSAGGSVRWDGRAIPVQALDERAFRDVDLALFSAGASVSRTFAPIAVEAGALVVDNSSAWRMAESVPLVVPEVNPEDIARNEGIIANPNCSTIPLTIVLEALRREVGLERVLVATYQSASGAGRDLLRELEEQVQAIAAGRRPEANVYPHVLAHNVVPGGWPLEDGGYNEEEMKIVNETRKILHDQRLRVAATCVRVPVPIAHSEAVLVETQHPLAPEVARELLGRMPGVVVLDGPEADDYPTPAAVAGSDEVYVGRIRSDLSSERGLLMWIVSDNLRKGAALNAVQVAERAVEMGVL